MTFKTTLYKALEAATTITLDGYEIDDDMLAFISPNYLEVNHPNSAGYYEFDLSQYDKGLFVIQDCEVEIDSDGYLEVEDSEGVTHGVELRVSRPLTQADL